MWQLGNFHITSCAVNQGGQWYGLWEGWGTVTEEWSLIGLLHLLLAFYPKKVTKRVGKVTRFSRKFAKLPSQDVWACLRIELLKDSATVFIISNSCRWLGNCKWQQNGQFINLALSSAAQCFTGNTQRPESGTGSWLGIYKDRREGEPTAETSSRQTTKQATWSLQWQGNAGRDGTDGTHTATITIIPNGASLVRPRNHSSDTRMGIEKLGTQQNVNAVLVQRGGGKQDPRWIINHWAGPDGGIEGWRDERPATAEHSQMKSGAVPA